MGLWAPQPDREAVSSQSTSCTSLRACVTSPTGWSSVECGQIRLQQAGVLALRQRRGRGPRGDRAGAASSRALQQPGRPGADASRGGRGVQTHQQDW